MTKEEKEKLANEYTSSLKLTRPPLTFFYEYLEEAFIAGLKHANQWHNLRKNPDDLPTCDCETITLHENGSKNIQIWRNRDWINAIVIPIVAWCEIPEIPKFEEEA